jgi:thiamine-phosphate pyrophosphorylase
LILYYITDRHQFAATESERRRRLLEKIVEAANAGIDMIQLREKDLSARELESLAQDAMEAVQQASSDSQPTRLLINSRIDVAIATAAAGVHLPANDLSAQEARDIFHKTGRTDAIVGVSCHTPAEVRHAENDRADFVVLGPVFEKSGVKVSPDSGLVLLQQVCGDFQRKTRVPTLALGGITAGNAALCMKAGASGIAGIRLFQQNDLEEVVSRLRSAEAR